MRNPLTGGLIGRNLIAIRMLAASHRRGTVAAAIDREFDH